MIGGRLLIDPIQILVNWMRWVLRPSCANLAQHAAKVVIGQE
jgi:hypothetical protein